MGRKKSIHPDVVGEVHGTRRIIADAEPDGHGNRRVRWLCESCGDIGETCYINVRRSRGCHTCRTKSGEREGLRGPQNGRHAGRAEIHALLAEARERCPSVWLSDTRESADAVAELAALLGPLALAEIGTFLGVSRERARQLDADALARLAPRLRLVGITEPPQGRPADPWTYPEAM